MKRTRRRFFGCEDLHDQHHQDTAPLLVILVLLCGLGLAVVMAACCSIIHHTRQEVGISSTPTSAKVTIDNEPSGNTPVVVKLKRKHTHTVKIELEGYQPFEMALTRKVSGWVWGNIFLGGFIGLIVDAANGSMYNLRPDQITASLAKQNVRLGGTNGSLIVMVVLRRDPSWDAIGSLKR